MSTRQVCKQPIHALLWCVTAFLGAIGAVTDIFFIQLLTSCRQSGALGSGWPMAAIHISNDVAPEGVKKTHQHMNHNRSFSADIRSSAALSSELVVARGLPPSSEAAVLLSATSHNLAL